MPFTATPTSSQGDAPGYRFYGDLARWWPLVSAREDYVEEAAFVATLLGTASIPVTDVLELGSGGGNNAFHLKAEFAMTLVDLSPGMADVSRRANPECHHHAGDMRSVRLGRSFDAVFMHDAIEYMTTEEDLALAIETAFVHCKPGGLVLLVPDTTRETFAESSDHGGHDGAGGEGVRYLEWSWDPDPDDSWYLTHYAFMLRERDGSVEVVAESHRMGLFAEADWLRLLSAAGFRAEAVAEVTTEDRPPRTCFVGRRPGGSAVAARRG